MLLSILWTLLAVVNVVLCILLIGIILLQRSRSHGAAAGLAFGAGMGEQLFGAQAGNILTRSTVVLLTAFLINTTILAVISGRIHGSRSVTDSLPSGQIPLSASPLPLDQAAGPAPAEQQAPPPAPPSGIAGEPVTVDSSAPEPPNSPPADNHPAQ